MLEELKRSLSLVSTHIDSTSEEARRYGIVSDLACKNQ